MASLADTTRYDPSETEPRIVERWLASGIFHPEPGGTAAENFSISIPPPNVTGSLHMGHALVNTLQDVLVRRARQRGRRTKWILGTDHAGIATQRLVEQALAEQGIDRVELGREAFIQKVWEWRGEYGGKIIGQLQRLGCSCDYEDEVFTLDPGYVRAVMKVFVDLYGKGVIYRDRYLVNWDPGLRSAISDLEVEQREVTDTLYSIDYDIEGGGKLTVATVRPETMLADTGVAVNPADDRFNDLIGQTAILPLVGRRLPIIGDDYVKADFGTGCLKITPGHDPNDFEIGLRHGLEQISVIGEDGRMSAEAGNFAGLTVAQARTAVVDELDAQGRIAAREPLTHEVPFSHRSGERIEPIISLQWFMDMNELAPPAIEAVTSGRITITPDNHRRVYLNWLENIRPWCISRQLWWGHQIPVWYRGDETYVGMDPPEGEGWTRDPDVLDTWFSSALWPFATLGWPEDTPELRAFYPTDVLVTARDIIFLWVARMVMMGIEFLGEIPFSDVVINPIIQAPDGRRMSKSLGTGIDPLDLIDGGPRPPVFAEGGEFPAYGADAVRFGLLAQSSVQDVRFSEERLRQGSQLTNKLFNASRLVLMALPDAPPAPAPRPDSPEDRWILSRLQRAYADVHGALDRYDFAHAALRLYEFVFDELCDWYLELVKPRLYDEAADREDLFATLQHLLERTLALASPVIPFVTEELWPALPHADGLLAAAVIEGPDDALVDEEAEAEVGRAIAAVQALRSWRASVELKPGDVVPGRLEADGYDALADQVGRLARFEWDGAGGDAGVASIAIPGGAVAVLAGGGFDPAAADRRRDEQRAKLQSEIERAEGKLANPGFVDKAPPHVVDAERAKLDALRKELEELE
jgi:valyl-tRNA synthetase